MSPSKQANEESQEGRERLQKVLATAGVASRRECEQWILDGRVEVDRQIVDELGTRVDPQTQEIRVDGSPIKIKRRSYYLLNKPMGVVSTNKDPEGRPRVIDLIQSNERLFPVGRLDRTSEGLILVTNDGELANQLAHPRFGVEKTYLATVVGRPSAHQLRQLREGVFFADGKAKVVSVHVKKRLREQTVLEIVLNEGRNREIRRLLAKVGHKVLRLKRTALGTIRLGDVPSGAYRELSRQELSSLRRLVKPSSRGGRASRPAATSRKAKRSAPGKGKQARSGRGSQAVEGVAKSRRATRNKSADLPSTGAIIGGDPAPTKKKSAKSTGKQGKSAGRSAGKRRTSRGGSQASGRGVSKGRKSGGQRS